MNNFDNPYAVSSDSRVAALADSAERSAFIARTYAHLAAAIVAFVVLEGMLLTAFPAEALLARMQPMLGGMGWLVILAAFTGVSWLARSWASSDAGPAIQYAGLGLYVVAQALLFLPLMAMSTLIDPSIPMNAGIITAIVFVGLTAIVFTTRVDLAGWGKFLMLAGLVAIGIVAASLIFGTGIGVWFSGLMVLLAAGYILYDTSNILHHYRTDQHVAAALALFASVALMLWYVIQILMATRD